MTSSPRVRMSPDSRREQLLDLGVKLLSTRSLDELSVELLAEEAGISRGLMYHYFGNKQEFREAVVRRFADDLFERTAPTGEGGPLEQMFSSMTAFVTAVVDNYEAYLSLVRGAAGGNEALRAIYDEARTALTDRIFENDPDQEILADTPASRLFVRGWASLVEEVVLAWIVDDCGLSRDELVQSLALALPGVVDVLPD